MVSKENGALFATMAFVMAATKNKQRAFCFGVSPRNVNSSRDDRGVSTRVNFLRCAHARCSLAVNMFLYVRAYVG